jgi:hypothetical protein
VACFKIFSRHSSGVTEENHVKACQGGRLLDGVQGKGANHYAETFSAANI